MGSKDGDRMANSVDPDQTALGAVWSGSALFAKFVCPKTKDHYCNRLVWKLGTQTCEGIQKCKYLAMALKNQQIMRLNQGFILTFDKPFNLKFII